jgi:hypothetical protein
MERQVLENLVIFAVCGVVAYKLLRWLWPIAKQRGRITPLQMIQQAAAAPSKELERQGTKFGSRGKTLFIQLVNTSLLLTAAAFVQSYPGVSLIIFAYQVIGLVLTRILGAPPAVDLEPLNLVDRISLRVFHAWLWPAYLAYMLNNR